MKITGKKYMGMVAALGCIRCGMPAEVHHIRQFSGMGQRGSDWLTIPLCPGCHRTAKDSIHNRNMDEGKFLAQTIETIINQLAVDRVPF